MARLNDDEITSRLGELERWERRGDAIVKSYKCNDFVGSVKLVDALTPVAEEMNHHPDLEISWNKVIVSLSTHSQGGITDSDFELAQRIEDLA